MPVKESPNLESIEKQFSIVGTKDEETLTVYSEVGSISRGLLSSDKVEVIETHIEDDMITGVKAVIPRGALKLKPDNPRKDNTWSAMI